MSGEQYSNNTVPSPESERRLISLEGSDAACKKPQKERLTAPAKIFLSVHTIYNSVLK